MQITPYHARYFAYKLTKRRPSDNMEHQMALVEEMIRRNERGFDVEMGKRKRWAEDWYTSLKVDLEELDKTVKKTRKAARLAPDLPEKLERQSGLGKLEAKRDAAWHSYDESSRELDRQKDALLDEISHRLEQRSNTFELFTICWSLK